MRKKILMALLPAVVLSCLSVGEVSAASPHLILWRDPNYGQDARNLFTSLADFNALSFNDVAKSLKVVAGTWEVCEDANFRGRCIVVTGDMASLGDLRGKISSARLLSEKNNDIPAGYGQKNDNRGGSSRNDDRGRGGSDNWRNDDRGRNSSRNDDRGGNSWGNDNRDRYRDRDDDWGRGNGSSNSRDGDIVLYADAYFRGASRSIDGSVRNLSSENFNDTVSSIRVNSGTWEVCEHASGGGRCMTIDRDVRWLGDVGFNDAISSVRRIR